MMSTLYRIRALFLVAAVLPGLAASTAARADSLLEQISPTPMEYAYSVDYGTPAVLIDGSFAFGPLVTDVTAEVFRVTGTDGVHGLSEGCSAGDFSGGVAGKIVLLSRGNCTFVQKTHLAQDAGALAVLIAENDPDYEFGLNIGGTDPALHITAFKLSYDLGQQLADQTLTQKTTIRVALGDHLVSALPAVPEPSSWALMLAGFGAIGGALRRRVRPAIA